MKIRSIINLILLNPNSRPNRRGNMKTETVFKRLYTFFVCFGIFVFIGTLVELSQLNHTREELQFAPFILLPLGIVIGILMLLKTSPGFQKVLIIGMWVVAVGGIIGMFVHVAGNLEGVLEGGQTMAFAQIVKQAIGGRNPLLAPGTLTIGAVEILAVAYAKNAIEKKK